MENLNLNKIVIASFLDDDKTGHIIIDSDRKEPFCDLCNSFDCIHVKYAMVNENIKKEFNDSLKLICRECGYFNLKGSKFCIMCGTPLEDDKQ